MISDTENYTEAFVWIWLPEETEPVVAGKLSKEGNALVFNYGKSYLERENAIPIHKPELPLQSGQIPLLNGLSMPGCLRDAAPDAWGRRVIINKKLGLQGNAADNADLDELTYMLESGSDRIGALDFQRSATDYKPRLSGNVSLDELLHSTELVERGVPLTPELGQALHHGTAIGGARPKVLIEDDGRKYIAKFSSTNDLHDVVKFEFIAMRLAAITGLSVAKVKLAKASHKNVLLIERFDRIKTGRGWRRKAMVSALTILELDEMMARYTSYEEFAEIIRHSFANASQTLKELYGRLVFNILAGNTDDHARNHAAFWNGKELSLTPAYDICPQERHGGEAVQAMMISGKDKFSRISTCLKAAPNFLLSREEAIAIIDNQIRVITDNWPSVCDAANLSDVDRNLLWGRQFFNPYAFEDLEGDAAYLRGLALE